MTGKSRKLRARMTMAARARCQALNQEHNPPSYLPTEKEIRLACLLIQESWSHEETNKRANGEAFATEPYGLESWMLCPHCQKVSDRADEVFAPWAGCSECERIEKSLRSGQFCNGSYYHNGQPEFHDIQYNGPRTDRFDTDPWWHEI